MNSATPVALVTGGVWGTSKGGFVALTHALAISLGPDIWVNCISPGWIDVQHHPLRPANRAQHPVGRVGQPDDIAALGSHRFRSKTGGSERLSRV
jgi:NAD(P)-dependent dehydrogenase (short-subunit alcohol dehydrogenase family)